MTNQMGTPAVSGLEKIDVQSIVKRMEKDPR